MHAINLNVTQHIKKDCFLNKIENNVDSKLNKQSLKVPDDPDYVWHKKPDEMDGYGDIWFFDLSYCDVNKDFLLIF